MNLLVSAIFALSVGQLQGNVPVVGSSSRLAPYQTETKSQSSNKVVLGKLGQASYPCEIYVKPDIGSGVYYSVKAYQYLVVNPAKESGWVKVLLQNGFSGYVQADSVKVMEYQVMGSKPGQDTKRAKSVGVVRAADLALERVGVTQESGLDSGKFVQQVFAEAGIKLSDKPDKQSKIGKTVANLEKLVKGDRVYFWVEETKMIDEVGIYLGNGYFVYLNEVKGEVETQYLGEKKWLKRLAAARR